MRTTIDEGVPRHLVPELRKRGIDAHVFHPAWKGLSNGALLKAIEEAGFVVLITNDRNIAHQQSLRGRPVAIVALPHNNRRRILERVDDIAETVRLAPPGHHLVIWMDGRRTLSSVRDGRVVERELPATAAFKP